MESLVPVLVAAIGSGGLITGIIAFVKLRPEKDSIVVTSAQGALLIQTTLVDQLKAELERCRLEIAEGVGREDALEKRIAERDRTIDNLRQELTRARMRSGREHRP